MIPGLAVALVGLALLRLIITGEAAFFVGPLVRPLLVVTAPVLVGMGFWQAWDALRRRVHVHTGKVLALLLVPLAIVVAGPQPLGEFTASRPARAPQSPTAKLTAQASAPPVEVDPATGTVHGGNGGAEGNEPNEFGSTRNTAIGPEPTSFPELSGDPAEIGVYDYVQRTTGAHLATIAGRRLALVGFVSRDPDHPDGPWVIARLKIWCCAADALPFMVTAVHAPAVPYGTWVRVTGTALPPTRAGDAQFKVDSVEKIAQPEDPYTW